MGGFQASGSKKIGDLDKSLVSYRGTTTADGGDLGVNLICSDLTSQPDFNGNQVVILSGACAGQARDINGATTGGTVIPSSAFDAQITEGTKFAITAIRTVPAEVAAIEAKLDSPAHGLAAIIVTLAAVDAKLVDPATGLAAIINTLSAVLTRLDNPATGFTALMNTLTAHGNLFVDPAVGFAALANTLAAILEHTGTTLEDKLDIIDPIAEAIKVSTDKLAGAAPIADTATKDWNSAEADVVSFGADDTKYKLHSLLLSIHNLVGTTITVRMYMEVKGTERKVYEQAFDATSDPPGLWIVNGTIGIHEVLRVALESNSATDNGKGVDYDYMLEVM